MCKILILSNRTDSHARTVYECLIKMQTKPIRWFTDEFISNQKIVQKITSNGEHSIIVKDQNIDLMDIDVVWYRRPKLPSLPNNVEFLDRKFIETENKMHMISL